MPLLRSTLTVALLAVLAAAETHKITVGSSTFDPGTITAAEGDVLQFYFDSSNHSVVSGSYQYACSPLQLGTGFYSGIVNSTGKVFEVEVNSTDPTPFYSAVGKDCPEGMVGIINPSANKTLSGYKDEAAKLASGVAPGNHSYGGQFVDDSNTKNNSDGSSSSSGDSGKGKSSAACALRVTAMGTLVALWAAFILV